MRHVPLCFGMDPTWLEAMDLADTVLESLRSRREH